MNGNANLNANNLTTQNVEDWRSKLGIDLIGKVETIYNNTSSTSAQAPSTITPTKTLKNYKGFIVKFARQTTNQTIYFLTNFKSSDFDWINYNLMGLWGYIYYQRLVQIRLPENTILIYDCYKQTSFGGGATDNTANIVTQILGIL